MAPISLKSINQLQSQLVSLIQEDVIRLRTCWDRTERPDFIVVLEGLPACGKTWALDAILGYLNLTDVLSLRSEGSRPPEGFEFWEFRKNAIGLFRYFDDPTGILWWLHYNQKRLLASRFWERRSRIWVLDRYVPSILLQMHLAHTYEKSYDIYRFAWEVIKSFPPANFVIYLDIGPDLMLRRLAERGRRNQAGKLDYRIALLARSFYWKQCLSDLKRWVLIDGSGTKDSVRYSLRNIFRERMGVRDGCDQQEDPLCDKSADAE